MANEAYVLRSIFDMVSMKGDAVIRVPRQAWMTIRSFAKRAKRDIREVAGTALETYVAEENAKKKN